MEKKLKSKRLIFERLEPYHRRLLGALYQNEACRAHLGGVVNEEVYQKKFDDMLRDQKGTYFIVKSISDQIFLGLVSLTEHHDGNGLELSYMLLPEFWGQGYGGEAARFVIQYGFKVLKLPRVYAETQKKNTASNQLLKGIGFKLESEVIRFGEMQNIYVLNAMCAL